MVQGHQAVNLALLRDILDAVELELEALLAPLACLFAMELAKVLDDTGYGDGRR